MGPITNYRDLLVWQRSMDLVERIYRIAHKLPDTEPLDSPLSGE